MTMTLSVKQHASLEVQIDTKTHTKTECENAHALNVKNG